MRGPQGAAREENPDTAIGGLLYYRGGSDRRQHGQLRVQYLLDPYPTIYDNIVFLRASTYDSRHDLLQYASSDMMYLRSCHVNRAHPLLWGLAQGEGG